MDRRRNQLKFVPMTDELEEIKLLSTLFPGTKTTTSNPDTGLNTLPQKQQRIERLPYYLNQTWPGRTIPASITVPLLADLNAIIGQLNPPGSTVLTAFNTELRKGQSTKTMSQEDAQTLNAAFGSVLRNADATPEQVTNLQIDMQKLTQYNVGSPSPGFITTNDYATVLQTALGVGKSYSVSNLSVTATSQSANKTFTSLFTVQVASNGFANTTVAHPTPSGRVEIHEVLTSTVPGRKTQTKDSVIKTVVLTAAPAIQAQNYTVTQATWQGTRQYKPVAGESITFYAKYLGDSRFTGSTSTSVSAI